MPKKQDYLKSICIRHYNAGNHRKPSCKELVGCDLYSDITEMYRSLGGKLETVPLNIGSYDIDLKDFIIELDEENHFNRYRSETLRSPLYDNDWKNFNVADYKQYCEKYEGGCLTYGKYWGTPSSDKQFGISSPNKDLAGVGASRWRQRAFYDFVKDVYSIVANVPIIRVSIYDIYKTNTIHALIQQEQENEILEYVESRVKIL